MNITPQSTSTMSQSSQYQSVNNNNTISTPPIPQFSIPSIQSCQQQFDYHNSPIGKRSIQPIQLQFGTPKSSDNNNNNTDHIKLKSIH